MGQSVCRYRTIVADPPWDHSDGTGIHVDEGRKTYMPYAPMSVAEIKALPVPRWAEGDRNEVRRVFADEPIEGAIVLRPETFYALKEALGA